ncbi:MAG: hypothetical protein AAFS07_15485 [Pseudomonadota bacterium]
MRRRIALARILAAVLSGCRDIDLNTPPPPPVPACPAEEEWDGGVGGTGNAEAACAPDEALL